MKKSIFIAIASIVGLSSCTDMSLPENNLRKVMSFNAVKESMADVKSALNGTSVDWVAGDKISVFDGISNNEFTTSDSGTNATFTGEASSSASSWYALSPYQAGASMTSGIITCTVPAIQEAAEGTTAYSMSVSKADVSGTSFSLKNICGLVELNLTASNVTSIILSGKAGEILAGTVSVTVSDSSDPVMTADGSTSVTLSKTDGSALSPGKYYIAIRPSTFNNGIRLSFTNTSGQWASIASSEAVTVSRSHILPISQEISSGLLSSKWEDVKSIKLCFNPIDSWSLSSPIATRISSKGNYPSFPGKELSLIQEGFSFEIKGTAGVWKSADRGLLFGKAAGDYIQFPSIEGMTLVKIAAKSSNNMSPNLSICSLDGTRTFGAATGIIKENEDFSWIPSGIAPGEACKMVMGAESTVYLYNIELTYAGSAVENKISSVATDLATIVSTEVTESLTAMPNTPICISGAFGAIGSGSFTCGFETKTAAQSWDDATSISATISSYSFSAEITPDSNIEYEYRAWASADGGTTKTYGQTQKLLVLRSTMNNSAANGTFVQKIRNSYKNLDNLDSETSFDLIQASSSYPVKLFGAKLSSDITTTQGFWVNGKSGLHVVKGYFKLPTISGYALSGFAFRNSTKTTYKLASDSAGSNTIANQKFSSSYGSCVMSTTLMGTEAYLINSSEKDLGFYNMVILYQ